jgi:spermidine synthase
MLFFSFTLYLSNSIVPIFDGIGRSDLVVYSILISTALASVLGGCVALLFPKTLRHPLKILGLLLIGSALFGCTSLIAIPELADWLIAKAEPSSIFSHVDQLSLFFQLIVYYLLLLGPPIILFISGMGLWLAISFSKQTSTEKRYGIILGSCILGMVMGISYSLFVDKDAFYTLYGTHPWVHWIVMLLIGIGIICASTRSTFKKNTHKENDTVKNGKPHSHLIKRITQSPLSDGSQRYLRGVIAVLTMVIGCSFVCFLLTHMPSILISLPNSLHYSAIQLVSLPILGSIILGLLILQIFPLRFYLLPILTVGTIALSIIFLLDYLMLSHISNGIPLGVNPIDGNLKLGGLSQLLPWSIPQGVLLGILLPILLVTFLALGPRTLRSIAQWIICLGIGMATGITLFVFMDGNQNLFLSSILFLIPLTIVLGIMLIISATIPLRNLIQQPSIIFCILFLVFTSGLLILFPRPSVMFADKRSHPVEPFPSFSTHVINNPYQQRRPADPKREPVYTKTSIYGEYAIYTHPQLHYLLYHNGIPRSARSKSEQLARLLSIQIPILLHPSIHRVLITAPTDGIELMAATCNTLSHIQVLQADPTLIQTAYVYLNGVYNQAFNHPSVRWSTVDFSTYTQLGQSNFDMIWVPLIGTANPKFYEQEADPSVWITSLKQKLNNSGIITCLVDLRFVSLASFNELVTQFAHLFAHLTIWEAERGFQYLILASDTPLHCSLFELDRRYNQPGNFRLFRSYGFEESEEIFVGILPTRPAITMHSSMQPIKMEYWI